jgi:anhydro-N-acetylmuramic acid kinase
MTTARVLGMISGTSHDGIDAAVVDFSLEGDALDGRIVHSSSTPYPAALRRRLVEALPPAPTTLAEVCELDTLIGQAFAEVAEAAVVDRGPVALVVSHGQTVFHWVEDSRALGTLQIGQPAWIAERLGTPVLSDVRIRDITAGGHGAPLVSFLDPLLLGAAGGNVAALNLGGISNMTVVRDGVAQYAYDIGPANALLDAVVVDAGVNELGYDAGGRIAASGRVDDALLDVLLDEPYYLLPVPKSTGKELFHLGYVRDAVRRSGRTPTTADLLATLVELTAATVARDVAAAGVDVVVASGGGVDNLFLMERLRTLLDGVRLTTTDDFGVPTDTKEAVAFALIGWHSWHGLPANMPAATGASAPRILGTFTPGRGPLVLPPPLSAPIRSLTLTDETGRGRHDGAR